MSVEPYMITIESNLKVILAIFQEFLESKFVHRGQTV